MDSHGTFVVVYALLWLFGGAFMDFHVAFADSHGGSMVVPGAFRTWISMWWFHGAPMMRS